MDSQDGNLPLITSVTCSENRTAKTGKLYALIRDAVGSKVAVADSTLEKLEKIVERQIAEDAYAGKITLAHFVSPAEPVKRAGVILRAAAWLLSTPRFRAAAVPFVRKKAG